MKKSDFLSLGIIITLIIVSTLNIFVGILNKYTILIFLGILILITYKLIGFQRNKSMIERDVILSITAILLLYYLVSYILGYFTGFVKSLYAHDIKTTFLNVFPVLGLIFGSEILRYMVNRKAENKTWLIFLSFLAFTLINTSLLIRPLVVDGNVQTMSVIEQLGLFILPSVTTSILMTFMSIKVGYKSSILFRLFMELPLYILPFFPNFGNYIDSVLRISIPVLFFLWLYQKIEKTSIKKIVIIEKKKLVNLFRINILLVCIILVYFISGLFRFQALVIASGSMEPSINIGDVVIVDKNSVSDYSKLKKGEVIAYRKDAIVICHRIVKIINSGEKTFYETKGDNNTDVDQLLVETDKVIGTVKYKIKYIGYPTVILNRYR